LIAGVTKNLTSPTPIVLLGNSFTPPEITAKLQSLVDLRTDVDTAKAATKAKLATEAAQLPSLLIFMNAFVTYVKAAYGNSPDVLADYGINPKLRAAPSVVAKAGAVAKRASTRAARHTMGSRQKAAVKGDVTGVVVTPVTEPKAPTPSPATGPSVAPTATPAQPATQASAVAASIGH
jgi:hypothetical protein